MTKLIHTADIHLKEFGDFRWQALEELLMVAQQNQVDLVTISGDLFNQDSHSQQLRDKLRPLFSKQSFKIIILPGNHDESSYSQGEFFGENVKLFSNQQPDTVEVDGCVITGIPFSSLSKEQIAQKIFSTNQLLDPKKINILLLHGELTDLSFNSSDFGEEGDKRYFPFSLSNFTQTKIDYLLAGHFHSKFHLKRLPNSRLKSGGYFVYPGSPVSITTKETGPRSVALIETGSPPKQLNLETHYYQTIRVTFSPDNNQEIFEDISKQLKQLPGQCTPVLEVTGFFNKEVLQLTELELHQKLKTLADTHKALFSIDSFMVKDVSTIFSSSLYQNLISQINQQEISQEEKELLTEELISALTA